ncbi:branched-chain amino acid ABC transporter substrate-binding protein [Variovorax sp. WS11]|uniref:ABC transporter substrate-binding protein n=1 Tax=Variovorax sp. WS11 TaxID=1105204 RepID=UPI000D0D7D3F|nr:ABC transporter substrate-binding protein [Variovorax sp. WS11]NDZ17586.1 ABC transporter substrate-binding protein [Variovorax sp. WS11]PSL82209.1 branched-chain amino acid ABC transporter substrate-binding protein [Variovorax sp. WS11]
MKASFIEAACAAAALVASFATVAAQYDAGANDKEIVLGNVVPYSGPLSSAGSIGKCNQAYFEMVNKRGGINGRKVKVISLDDSFNPARTLEQTRRLVEREQVLLVYGTFGTATNTAIHQYLNQKQVPHLMLITGASKWNNAKEFPWSMAFLPSYPVEAASYARYVLENVKEPRIAVLYQNDDYGKEYRNGLRAALGNKADKLIVSEQSYEVSDPTLESQIGRLKASGANVLLNVTAAKFATQAVKLVNDSGWKPLHLLVSPASNLDTVVRPAGLEASQGIVSAQFMKDPTNPIFRNDPDVKDWLAWKQSFYPAAVEGDWWNWACYAASYAIEQVLKGAGEDLRRANVMKVASTLKDLKVPMLMDGIHINTTPTDLAPVNQMYMMRLSGDRWEPIKTAR